MAGADPSAEPRGCRWADTLPALRGQPAIFPALYGRTLAAAEQSGALADVCRQLAHQQQQAHALRQRLLRALRYPLFLLSVALLIALGMLLTLLPQFAQLYASLDAPLPWLTQQLLTLADALRRGGTGWPRVSRWPDSRWSRCAAAAHGCGARCSTSPCAFRAMAFCCAMSPSRSCFRCWH
ncbi:type II secretion system F family protein [Edwardsiella anguillarum]|nr:type II secretion system F family protein [Edwardsiella anguillarum]